MVIDGESEEFVFLFSFLTGDPDIKSTAIDGRAESRAYQQRACDGKAAKGAAHGHRR